MFGSERRQQSGPEQAAAIRRGLTPAQLSTIQTLEAFQWSLAFVRRPLFRDPIPVMLNRQQDRHVVIGVDGSIDETPTLRIR